MSQVTTFRALLLRGATGVAGVFAALLAATASGCVTDFKGQTCDPFVTFEDEEGNQYCPDATAPGACDAVVDVLLTQASLCSGLDRASVEAEFNAPFACEDAIATKPAFEACIAQISTEPCDGANAVLPAACSGAVIFR